MQAIDKQQQSSIMMLGAVVGTITALIAIMNYINNHQHQKLEQEVLVIDKEIKLLNLAQAKNNATKIAPENSGG